MTNLVVTNKKIKIKKRKVLLVVMETRSIHLPSVFFFFLFFYGDNFHFHSSFFFCFLFVLTFCISFVVVVVLRWISYTQQENNSRCRRLLYREFVMLTHSRRPRALTFSSLLYSSSFLFFNFYIPPRKLLFFFFFFIFMFFHSPPPPSFPSCYYSFLKWH